MIAPKIPENEEQRLKTLKMYNILDIEPIPELDNLTELACKLFGTKFAFISLVDESRQWFLSKQGGDIEETPREVSFCGHAINQNEIFQIEDASQDERFNKNPFVENDPNIRFYAGYPLTTPNHQNLGTFCIIDDEKKSLNEEQQELLKIFSKHAMKFIELSKAKSDYQTLYEESQTIQDVTLAGGWEVNFKTGKVHISETVRKIYAIGAEEELPIEKGINFYAEHERPRIEKLFNEAVEQRKTYDEILQFVDRKGTEKWVRTTGNPIIEKDGSCEKVVGAFQDVTEFINYKNKLASFYEKSPLGLSFQSLDKGVVDINNKFTEILGYTNDDLDTLNNLLDMAYNNNPTVKSLFDELHDKKEVGPIEIFIPNKQGKPVALEIHSFLMKDIDGTEGIWSIYQEIEEKKSLEQQLIHSSKLASIGELAAGIGHEINNPLGILMGQVEKLKKMNIPGSYHMIHRMEVACDRMAKIVNGLRNTSRTAEGIREPFRISKAMEETLFLIQNLYEKEGIKFNLDYQTNDEAFVFKGSYGQIQQVLMNIIVNAKDAILKQETKEISIQGEIEENFYTLKIRDSGGGISKENINKIFTPFFTTKDVGEGTGLGLSLSYEILAGHQVNLFVNTDHKNFTEFTMKFPVEKIKQVNEVIETIQKATSETFSGRVLVVDDEEGIREILEDILIEVGFEIETAGDGEIALQKLRNRKFDIVISDMQMPNMGGVELLNKIHFENIKLKHFFFITGGINVDLDNEQFSKLISGYLYKPFKEADVMEVMANTQTKN